MITIFGDQKNINAPMSILFVCHFEDILFDIIDRNITIDRLCGIHKSCYRYANKMTQSLYKRLMIIVWYMRSISDMCNIFVANYREIILSVVNRRPPICFAVNQKCFRSIPRYNSSQVESFNILPVKFRSSLKTNFERFESWNRAMDSA